MWRTYPKADPDEFDIALVKAGLITEEERIARAYRRILQEQLERGFISAEAIHP